MHDILSFFMNHWMISSAFLLTLSLFILNELISKKQHPAQLTPSELVQKMNHEAFTVIDIRSKDAWTQGHITHSICIPGQTIDSFSSYKDKPCVIVCNRGITAQQLAMKLKKEGFKQVTVLAGGISAWQEAGLPLIK